MPVQTRGAIPTDHFRGVGARGTRRARGMAIAAQVGAMLLLGGLAIPEAAVSQEELRVRRFDVVEATIADLQEAMTAGRVTAVELVDAFFARISAYDQTGPSLNAMIRLNPRARAEAEALDQERATRGPRGMLHGIPIVLKDNYDTADMPTTGGSIALAGSIPPDDAFQVRKLREAGAVILGKANLHELAMGISTISSLGGQTLNPYDLARNPGGSSGGTGAAVAASFAVIGWGTDTCGSIRIPASQNNLFGLRPTKGLSSIDGVIPLAHTQDVAGPLARTATDLAIGLDATSGPDSADSATRAMDDRPAIHFADALDSAALGGARLGVLKAAFGDGADATEMADVVRAAIDQMHHAGAELVEVDVPGLDTLLDGASVIPYEFKFDFIDYLAATPDAPVGSLQEILDRGLFHSALESRFRRRNEVATRDSEEYRAALARRAAVRDAIASVLDRLHLDALVYPTMRRRAAYIGDPQRGSNCAMSAVSGLPALTVPAGFTAEGLPAGVELLGAAFSDARLLALGYAFEQRVHPRRPPSTTPPLEKGSAPNPKVFDLNTTGGGVTGVVRFRFDPTTSSLWYEVTVSVATEDRIYGVHLHDAGDGQIGPVVHRLSGSGVSSKAGRLVLDARERDALMEGTLYVSVYTRQHPTGATRSWLVLPE